MATRITATLPNGVEVIKKTTVPYTHILAVKSPSGTWFVGRWSSSLSLAQKAADTVWLSYPDRQICQVNA
jgi:hypothetical protein